MQTLLYEESPMLGFGVTLLAAIAAVNQWFALFAASIVVLAFLVVFYRYSPHPYRYDDRCVVSPAEGTITELAHCDGYLHISIFLSPFNQHTQIYPVNGTVIHRVYDETGQFNLAITAEKSHDNEKKIHTIRMTNGKLMQVTQIAGFLPRRIVSSDRIPQTVRAGEDLGMIKFGSRVDILTPCDKSVHVLVKRGDQVNIGQILTYS